MSKGLEKTMDKHFPKLINKAKSSPGAKACPLSVGFIMSITYIAIGAVYFHDCPVQEMIPIYLIVTGAVFIILSLSACLPCTQNPKGRLQERTSKFFMLWSLLMSMFLFCWFIAGNYWIYSVFEPIYNKNGTDVSRYCNKTLYRFSFWTTTLFYILLCVLPVTCCWCFCCMFLCCVNHLKSFIDKFNSSSEAAEKDEGSSLAKRNMSEA